MSDEGVKQAVSPRVWPPRRRGDSGTANTAAPKDSTTHAAKDGPVWFHCSTPAVRYEGKHGANSARASHSENEPSMKGLNMSETCFLCHSDVSTRTAKVKRRVYHECSAEEVRTTLDSWTVEAYGFNLSNSIFKNAYMCDKCITAVNDVEKLIMKARVKKNDVLEKVKSLFGVIEESTYR